ncbi:MAG: selenium metabolism-associated LysR family transcriptional regulator [Moorellaceae bacterium]
MNLGQLETFIITVEKGTLSAAAEELHLTQPAVSKQLKALEEFFGARLLDRSGREVRLTEGGRIFYRRAREILRLWEQLRRELAEANNLVRGELLLGASTIPGHYVLPRLLGSFKAKYPQVEIKLEIAASEEIIKRILEGEIELGVVGAEERKRGLVYQRLVEDELILIVPPDHPWAGRPAIQVADLAEASWVWRKEGSGTRRVAEEQLKAAGCAFPSAKIVAELGSTEAIVNAVEAGLGVSLVSRWAAEKSLRLGRIAAVPLEGVNLKRYLYLVRRTRELTPAALAFIEFAEDWRNN